MKTSPSRLPSWTIPFLLGNILMFSLMALAIWAANFRGAASKRTEAIHELSRFASNRDTTAPWGEIEALEFPLADANDMEADYQSLMEPPRWFFQSASEKQLARYFITSNVRYRDRHILMDKRYWKVGSNGCEITPPLSVVYALDSANRAKIYAALARCETNRAQRAALLLPQANLEQHLLAIGLTRRQITTIEQLTYTNANMLCLADLGIAQKLLGPEAFQKLVEYLYAIPAYRLRLVVSEHSDIPKLTAYWGKGGREDKIRPLLKSLARVPGGADISISDLLPDFARLRLYRFPDEQGDPTANSQDCIYSAMNFFRSVPDTNFFDMNYVKRVLEEDYEAINDAPTFGDLILLQDQTGKTIHMSVYIAADFVFTKNGMSPSKPWALMHLDDMLAVYYGQKQCVALRIFRLKKPGQFDHAASTAMAEPARRG